MASGNQLLTSEIDGSLNQPYDDGSEFRLVRRGHYDTVYCSSHMGCALRCKMCWLTASGQTKMVPLLTSEIVERAERMLGYRKDNTRSVNFAFMARGDALMSTHVNGHCVRELLDLAGGHAKVSLSTIFPMASAEVHTTMMRRFGAYQPTLYWSLYTLDDDVRAEWLPKAGDPSRIAKQLAMWQRDTGLELVVHHALIDGVNDSTEQVKQILGLMCIYGLRYRVNLVRFNPMPGSKYKDAPDATYEAHAKLYRKAGVNVQVRPRVGPDVYASCGQFVGSEP